MNISRQSIHGILVFTLLLQACAAMDGSFRAGDLKNSLPLISGREQIEEVWTIAVPPFSGDSQAWTAVAGEVLSSVPKVSVLPRQDIDSAIGAAKKDPGILTPEERIGYVTALGRAVRADAVLNGVLLNKEGRQELVLQLFDAKNQKILWWQAVDFSYKDDRLTKADQKKVLNDMLSSLVPHLAKKQKPVPAALPEKQEMQKKPGQDEKIEMYPYAPSDQKKPEKKKPVKKPGKAGRPQPPADDISPM